MGGREDSWVRVWKLGEGLEVGRTMELARQVVESKKLLRDLPQQSEH
jgi:hypothetical protein